MYYKSAKWSEFSSHEIFYNIGSFIRSKVFRLIVPLICVCFLYMDFIKVIIGVPGYELNWSLVLGQLQCLNIGHLCFLPCLFTILVCMVLVRNNYIGMLLFFMIFSLLNYKSGALPERFQLNQTAYYLVFIYLGYLINHVMVATKGMKIKISVSQRLFLWLLIGSVGNHGLCCQKIH